MSFEKIFDDGSHSVFVINAQSGKTHYGKSENIFAICEQDGITIIDSGGIVNFAKNISYLTEVIELDKVKRLVYSHHDPDVMSSLGLFSELCENATIVVPSYSDHMLEQYGFKRNRSVITLNSDIHEIALSGGKKIQAFRSQKNLAPTLYSFFDETSKMLFSSDIGSFSAKNEKSLFCEDFESVTDYLEPYIKSQLYTRDGLQNWVSRVKKIKPDIICPQKGSLYTGESAHQLLEWLDLLRVD